MAEMWYYTCEGKQMEPVSGTELKQLAASGMLKPTDMVWKEGMPKWVRASAAKGLFANEGMIAETPSPPRAAGAPGKKSALHEELSRVGRDDRPRGERRRDPDRDDDDDEYDDDRPRRRRRRDAKGEGMATGLKVGLILGGGILAIVLIVVGIVLVARSGADNPQAKGPPNNPAVQGKAGKPVNVPAQPQANPVPIAKGPVIPPVGGVLPIHRGPLNVGPGGLLFKDRLGLGDPRASIRAGAPPVPCKVYAINMVAGKTYTIRHNSNQFDTYLRILDSTNVEVAQDDDDDDNPNANDLNARLTFSPDQTGVYRVVATTFDGQVGSFTLQIVENR